ncbi:uncharacterized protein N7529_007924 [Penicillium soppii]|uniref:uncharacterized protein n=1 Tax=Penicillium soppii TaxID=69789 RepID=UPI0025492D76|nr:uncharacterized protein N7529_007924 [Penicillium soppii]KAJ5860614.1 hypothetical protein N7529_007924 [Penicillium soppii]
MVFKDKRKFDDEAQNTSSTPKQRKVIGPSLPPTAPTADATDSSESDDDFGPSLPPSDLLSGSNGPEAEASGVIEGPSVTETAEKENQRDQWMLQPPTQSDWASKIDPTQLRSRKFNTGKSATATKKMDSSWVETPEERMRRLQDAVMGIGASKNQARGEVVSNTKSKEDQIRRYNEKNRTVKLGSSEQAQKEDDDPSARAFDREKDMAVSGKISSAQRREMVKKAADYDTRFTKGNFL